MDTVMAEAAVECNPVFAEPSQQPQNSTAEVQAPKERENQCCRLHDFLSRQDFPFLTALSGAQNRA
jgi:hypothetical protein